MGTEIVFMGNLLHKSRTTANFFSGASRLNHAIRGFTVIGFPKSPSS